MQGEKKLDTLLRNMQPTLCEKEYVFCTLSSSETDMPYEPVMTFREEEGVTVIIDKETAIQKDMAYTYSSRMITLNIHSDLDAVGFLARVSAKLAKADISVNAVSAYFHDHLFVPSEKADNALNILKEMALE